MNTLNAYLLKLTIGFVCLLFANKVLAQLPTNDSCQSAIEVSLGSGGFAIGTFQSDSISIDSATLQVGEYFHSSLISSGNDKKTIWYKFYIPARRGVNIELKQNANAIATKDVGFTTYLTDQCLPASTAATNAKLTTLNQFGSSFHPCMDPGWYLVQVSSKARALGKVYLEITTIYPHQYPAVVNAEYDDQDSAYNFGDQVVGKYGSQSAYVDYEMGCYTISDSTEFFKDLGTNYLAYNQSAWFSFKANRDHDNTQLKFSHKSGCATTDTIAYRLFKGDCRNGGSLQLLDSSFSDWKAANTCYTNCSEIVRDYKCLFDSGETYSIQLLYHKDLIKTMRFRISDQTSQYDSGRYQPNTTYAKQLGVIRGNNNFHTGFSCKSYIKQNACGNANTNDIAIGSYQYNLAQWYGFELDQQSKLSVQFSYGANGNYKRYQYIAFRLFKDTIIGSCSGVDTSSIVLQASGNGTYTIDCLEPGKYSIQLLGTDTVRDYSNWPCSGSMHLGGDYRCYLNQSQLPVANRFALTNTGEGDSINSLGDLPQFSVVNGQRDTVSCNDALRPLEICDTAYKKAMYRTFVIGDADNDGTADSGMLYMSNWQTVYRGYPYYDYNAWHRIYKGNALALRSAQSVSGYPDTLTGLSAHSSCFPQSTSTASACLEPGTYTLVSYFDSIGISRTETPRFQFFTGKRKFNTYAKAEFIDSITGYGTYAGALDTFNCKTNPDTIDGQFCGKRNSYHVFYLDSTAVTTINSGYSPYYYGGARFTLFTGDIRKGKSGLKLYQDGLDWSCTGYYRTTSDCKPLEAGWYTVVVSNNWDIDYDSTNRYQTGSSVGLYQYPHRITITTRASSITPPKYYRPSKAAYIDSLVNGNNSLSYDTNYSTINGMYLNLAKYTFPKEILECDLDTPLNHHPKSTLCDTNATDIVYYTFTTAKDAYVRIYANKSGGTWDVKLFDFDVRKDSAKLGTATPIQDCNYDANFIAFCNLLAGTYSVVYYCKRTAGTRASVQPVMHMDSVYDSRFDHAINAYDFGKIPGNGTFYDGKIGDIHPNDTSLPASHDVITCRTGAQRSDPTEVSCYNHVSPYVYSKDTNAGYFLYDSSNYRYGDGTTYRPWSYPVRRNLWYSFVVEGRGNVTVDLKGITSNLINGTSQSLRFAIYESDEDGSISLASLKSSGKLDSTKVDGLKYIDEDYIYCYYSSDQSATFAISSCEKVKPRRYYVLVETTNYYNQRQAPNLNHNLWLEIKYDSLYIPDTKFDYYSSANDINGLNDANLLVNGGFDATAGWTGSSGSWLYNRSDVTPLSGGHAWAYYKPYQSKGDTGIIYQVVDVSNYASYIAAGSATSNFTGYFQSLNESNADQGRVKLQFLNSSGGVISQYTSSWIKSIGSWQAVSDSRTIPTGTVKVLVQIEALYKSSNSYTDVFVDAFDLRVSIPNRNNPSSLIGQRLYQGDKTYFAGSTLDSSDYSRTYYYSNCSNSATAGTVWYKFDVDSTGFLHYNYLYSYLSGTNTLTRTSYDNNRIRVYRSTTPGDSLAGLSYISPISSSTKYNSLMNNGRANYICVNPGTYYVQINKCDQHACSDYVIPQLVFDFHTGDFCETAVPLRLDSLGLVKDRLLVDCHTIGTDFGEDGSDMGCLYGPKDYKSSWFVVDYTDTTKVDLEFKLGEYTDAKASEIRYRTYYGNCKSLTSGPCNNNALTTFTLDCIRKGTYYVQIVTPDGAKGELEMSAEAKVNTDTTCNPVDIFQPNAAFYYNTGCPENVIEFVNTSSRGDSIRYFWDFGYNSLTDTALNPTVIYPPSSEEKSYTVKLVVEQIAHGSKDSIEIVIDVPFAPNLDIVQNDTNLCVGDSITLTAVLSHGDGVWSTGDSSSSITVKSTGTYFYEMQDKPHLLDNASLERSMSSYGWTISSGTWNRTGSYSPRDSSYVGYASHSTSASTGILEAYQDIDISSDSFEIDSGIAKTSITGFIRGHSSYEDEGQVILQYLDGNNNLLAIYQSGLTNYGNNWQYLEHSRTTPKSTRKLRVILQSNKVNKTTTTSYSFFDFLKVKMRSACPYKDSVYVQINPYPVLQLPTDTTICSHDSIAIRPIITYPNPYLVKDSMNKSMTGSLKNSASHSASDGYVQLTSNLVNSQNGQIEWEDSTLLITDTFTVTFDYFSTGKNYYALWFYLFNTTTPTNEDFTGGGYSYAFDGNNQLQLEWNNSRLSTQNTGIDLDNGDWHSVKIFYRNQYVEIYVDGVLYISYTDGTTRTQTGFKFGIGARSYYSNEYRLKNVQISKNNDELIVITPVNERMYNYTWSDASIDSVRFVSPIKKLSVSVVDGFGCGSNTDSIEINQFPKIDSLFTSDENICSLLDSFNLTKPDTNGYFYGNSSVDSAGLVLVDSASFGANTVYFSVVDTNGCVARDTGVFLVDSIPVIVFNPVDTLCRNDSSIQLVVNHNDGYYFGGTYVDSSGIFNPSLTSNTINKVYYKTNSTDCQAIDSINIVVDTIPNASILPAGPFCENDTTQQLKSSLSISGVFTTSSYIDSTGLFNPKIALAGNHTVYFTAESTNGCKNTDSTVVQVDSLPDASIKAAGPFCENAGIQLVQPNVPSGKFTVTSYLDSLGNFNPGIAKAGNHLVVYNITNGNGCSNSDSIFVVVDTIPSISIKTNQPYCENGSPDTLVGLINTGGKFSGGSFIDTNGVFNPFVAQKGSHKVYYSFTDANGCSSVDSVNLQVDTITPVTINTTSPYCSSDTVSKLTASPSLGGFFSGGSYIDSAGNFNPANAGQGSHSINYTQTNGVGCTTYASTVVYVDSVPDAKLNSVPSLCLNDDSVQVKSVYSDGRFVVETYLDSLGWFKPLIAGVGSHRVIYERENASGCVGRDTLLVQVDSMPNASINSAGPFCESDTIQTITGQYNSYGKYIQTSYLDTTGRFDPTVAKVGSHKVVYVLVDGNGCSSRDSIIVKVDSLPNAKINAAGPFCENDTIQFVTAQNSGGKFIVTSYLDSVGRFDPSIAQKGSHTVLYQIINNKGCIGKDSMVITIDSLPDASIQSAGPFCENAGVQTLSAAVNSGGVFTTKTYIDSVGKFDPAIAKSGSHLVNYKYTDGNGCSSEDSAIVVVDTIPDASIMSAGPFCFDAGIKKLVPQYNTGGRFGPLPDVDSAGNFNPMTAGVGSHIIRYSFSDGNGCQSIDSISIVVDSLPNAAIQDPGSICFNAGIQQLNPVNSGGRFIAAAYIDTSGKFNPAVAGIGKVKIFYELTNGYGCSSIDSLEIEVDSLPNAKVGTLRLCENDSARLVIPELSGGRFASLTYIDTKGLFNPSISKSGSHKVYYEITDGNGCTSNDSNTVTVDSIPNASIDAAGPFCLDAGINTLSAQYNSGGKFGPLPYIDSVGDFNPMTSGVGTHKVRYSFTDGNGCKSIDSISVVVDSLPNAAIQDPGAICLNAGIQLIKPVNSGGRFVATTYIDTIGNFDPLAAGLGTVKVFYEINNGLGCSGTDSLEIRVDSLPNAKIGTLRLCENDTSKLVVPVLPGGVFRATTFIDTTGLFNPVSAKSGSHKVYYSLTDGNGCTSVDSNVVTVDSIPDASIAQAGPFCLNSGVKTLASVYNAGGEFGPLPYMDSAGHFDPMIAQIGDNKIYYTFKDGNGCINTDSSIVKVDSLPNASIQDPGAICLNAGIQVIKPELVGGKFIVDTYIDTAGNFNPVLSGIGTSKVYYELNDGAGCVSRDSIEIRVDSIPNAAILPIKVCENSDTITLIPEVYGGRFIETIYLDSTGLFDPKLATSRGHKVFYEITDGNQCYNLDSNIAEVDTIPNATIKPAGPFCPNANDQVISPEVFLGGKFLSSSIIDTNGLFKPTIAGTGDHKIFYEVIDGNGCNSMDSAIIKVDSFPDASIKPSGPYCKNDTVALLKGDVNVNGRFSPTSFLDTLGWFDPFIADVGNHKIFYTIVDGNGCSNVDSISIQVDSIPNAEISPAGPFCENGGIQNVTPLFNTIGSFRTETYLTAAGVFDPSISKSGQHWVVYAVTDGNGCSNKDSLYITVDTIPDARIVTAGPFCVNDVPQQLVPQQNNGGVFTGTATSATGLFEPSIATPGNHRIYYTFTDGNSCAASDSIQVVVNDIPNAGINAVLPKCLNDVALQLTTSTVGGSFNGGAYITSTGMFDPSKASVGMNKVVYTITNSFNCTASDSIEIEVLELPSNTISLSPHEGCEPLPVFVSTEKVGNEDSIAWYLVGQFQTNQYNFNKTFDKNVYPISLRVYGLNGCNIVRDTTLEVFPKPIADFDYSPEDIYISSPLVTFNDLSALNIVGWDWDFGDLQTSIDQDPTHRYTEGGEYPVTLVVENDKGCLDTTQQILIVNDELLVFIPNAVSPNGDGNNDVFKLVGLGYENIKIQIFNRWGERIYESDDFVEWDATYMGEKVQMGSYVYIMTITDIRGMKYHKKGEISVIR